GVERLTVQICDFFIAHVHRQLHSRALFAFLFVGVRVQAIENDVHAIGEFLRPRWHLFAIGGLLFFLWLVGFRVDFFIAFFLGGGFFGLHLVVCVHHLGVGLAFSRLTSGLQRIDNQFFHRIVLSVGFNLVLSGFAHDFYRFADEHGLAVVIDEVLLLQVFGVIAVDEAVRPHRFRPKPLIFSVTLAQLVADGAGYVVEREVGGISEEKFGLVDQTIAGAVDTIRQAGNFDLLLITF